MGKFIIKPDRDKDMYVEFDEVMDLPVWSFTRAEFLEERPDQAERLDRADQHGSSARPGLGDGRPWYGWHEETFRIQDWYGDGWVDVQRAELPDVVDVLADKKPMNTRWAEHVFED